MPPTTEPKMSSSTARHLFAFPATIPLNPKLINVAYRFLSLKRHPDKNPGDLDAHERMVELNVARSTLLREIEVDPAAAAANPSNNDNGDGDEDVKVPGYTQSDLPEWYRSQFRNQFPECQPPPRESAPRRTTPTPSNPQYYPYSASAQSMPGDKQVTVGPIFTDDEVDVGDVGYDLAVFGNNPSFSKKASRCPRFEKAHRRGNDVPPPPRTRGACKRADKDSFQIRSEARHRLTEEERWVKKNFQRKRPFVYQTEEFWQEYREPPKEISEDWLMAMKLKDRDSVDIRKSGNADLRIKRLFENGAQEGDERQLQTINSEQGLLLVDNDRDQDLQLIS